MEKRGEILNQLAIISDLLDNMNLEAEVKTIIFEVSDTEFQRMYDLIFTKKTGKKLPVKNTYSITIGEVQIIFNKNSA